MIRYLLEELVQHSLLITPDLRPDCMEMLYELEKLGFVKSFLQKTRYGTSTRGWNITRSGRKALIKFL